MPESSRSTEFFETLARVLLRCWIFGFLFVTFWFGMSLLAGETIHQLHGKWFEMTRHEFDLIFYCGIGLTKLFVITFFLIPWLAIRLTLPKHSS